MSCASEGGVDGVVAGEKEEAVLVHADSFFFCVFGEGAVQGFGDPKFELTGVVFGAVRFQDINACFDGGGQPFKLGVFCVGDGVFQGISAADPEM